MNIKTLQAALVHADSLMRNPTGPIAEAVRQALTWEKSHTAEDIDEAALLLEAMVMCGRIAARAEMKLLRESARSFGVDVGEE
jgi:hypothetical protein